MTTQGASSTSSTRWMIYDVFLSFRGEDTRKSFTDHLHDALKRKGFNVFLDDEKLGKGKSIAPELCKAIEESRILMIVFSRNYASSTWCLDELVHIVQCMRENKQKVIPIFYDVDPSMARKQTGCFQEAFIKHDRENIEKVQNWRNALKEVANLSGFHLENRRETKFIQDIVEKISKLIPILRTHEDLVGMSSLVEKLNRYLSSTTKSDGVQMIGIYGMGGIGKTTIARYVYDLNFHDFEGSSFVANVREISKRSPDGLVDLQKRLLYQILGETCINIYDAHDGINKIQRMLWHKKVLIVIDDVDDIKQLSNLVGKHNWFGLDSKIIITTRDKHLLVTHGVDELFEVEQLNNAESLELFSSKAFKHNQPSNKYLELSKQVVNYAGGLPLALEVLGSFLFGKTLEEWESALEQLHRHSEIDILGPLQISFDGLKETEKKIFLDIACFFKGENKDHVIRILDGCGFSPHIGISRLVDKCLLNITIDNQLWMHDLLQQMGQQIIKKESPKEPGKRSRVWEKADVLRILTKNMGTEVVEGIILENGEQLHISGKAFLKMTNLRILKIQNVQLFEGLEHLSSELSLLEWHGYSLKSLPLSVQLDKTIILELQYSCIEQMWKEIRPLKKLKVINLRHSKMFKKTPDFTELPNLEELNLEGCTRLYDIHPSLLVHKKLILLNMKDCISLTTLPSEIGMDSLKKLVLSGCLKLKKFPEILGSMECLAELFLDKTAINELPLSIQFLKGLLLLSLEECKNLVSLPNTIDGLKSLKTIKLSGCQKLENLPENIGQIESLEVLDVKGTATREPMSNSLYSSFLFSLMARRNSVLVTLKLPPLSGLISLKELDLSYRNIEVIPSDIGNLASLEKLFLQGNNFVSLPASINRLSKVREFFLSGCKRLQSIPELPSNVKCVVVDDCISLETLSINALKPHPFSIMACRNCFRLVNYDLISTIFSALKKEPKPELEPWPYDFCKETFVFILGSEIPKWFSYQSEGSSMKIKGRRDLKLKGYAICVVFLAHKLPPNLIKDSRHNLSCNISCWNYNYDFQFDTDEGFVDHLWFQYIPVDACMKPKDWYDFELEFTSDSPLFEVRRCGAQPIYEEVEQFYTSSDSRDLIGLFHQGFVATTKRSLTDCDGAEQSEVSTLTKMDHNPKDKRYFEFS